MTLSGQSNFPVLHPDVYTIELRVTSSEGRAVAGESFRTRVRTPDDGSALRLIIEKCMAAMRGES
jgi:hypothetical protein